jgi:hypothetical protein
LPLIHFVEDVALSSMDNSCSIFSTLHLHWPSDGFVVNFNTIEAITSKLCSGLDIISERDIFESFFCFQKVIHALMILFNVSRSQIITNCALCVSPLIQIMSSTNKNIYNDLTIIIDDISASMNGSSKICSPNNSTIDGINWSIMFNHWEYKRNGRRGNNILNWI